jgi:hypothetical protein
MSFGERFEETVEAADFFAVALIRKGQKCFKTIYWFQISGLEGARKTAA